jgi:hypothetical protein
MQPESGEPKVVIALKGGPFDGCFLDADLVSHSVTEIIFRTTDYFPAQPKEIVYRSCGAEMLSLDSILKTAETRVSELPFRPQEQSQVMERLQAQDRDIKRLVGEVSELVEENKRLKARLARKKS